MNRAEAALRNIQHLCPPLATIPINSYRQPTDCFVNGNVLQSREGTTQQGILWLCLRTQWLSPSTHPLYKQNCKTGLIYYADDATAVGRVRDLRAWWNDLISSGLMFGYFVNASKTWVLNSELHDRRSYLLEGIFCMCTCIPYSIERWGSIAGAAGVEGGGAHETSKNEDVGMVVPKIKDCDNPSGAYCEQLIII